MRSVVGRGSRGLGALACAALIAGCSSHGADGDASTGDELGTSATHDGAVATTPDYDAGACGASGGHVVPAREHLASWGVNVDIPSDAATIAKIADVLDRIGFRRIRAPLVSGGQSNLPSWQALQAQMMTIGAAKPRLAFDDLVIAYMNDQATTWDNQQPAILAAAGLGLLASVQGPNEMNNSGVGNGSHGVNATSDQTANWAGAQGNVFAWANALYEWKSQLTGTDAMSMLPVMLVAPTIASGMESDYMMLPDLSAIVDEGDVHYYSGGGQQPNLGFGEDNDGVGYFANVYRWSQTAMSAGKRLDVSECGATTPGGSEYTPHAQAAYLLNQMHDAAGIGAAWFTIYALFDASTGSGGDEGNFGIVETDGTDKPISTALAAVKELFSLNNDYTDPRNASDTAGFKPGYDGCGLTVTGIGSAGYSSRVADAVVYPKSDGSTIISVTNEAPLTDGNGNDVTPVSVTAHVDLQSTQSWRVYDPLSAAPLVPIAQGTGSTVDVVLDGYPMYIELDAP